MNSVKVNLHPDVEAFIRFIYKARTGPVTIDSTHDIGKVIISQLQRNSIVKLQSMENSMVINVPSMNLTAGNTFLTISKEGIMQIESFVVAFEHVYFIQMVQQLKSLGYTNIKAVEAYLLLTDSDKNTDGITKRQYRKKKKMINRLRHFSSKIGKDIAELLDSEII